MKKFIVSVLSAAFSAAVLSSCSAEMPSYENYRFPDDDNSVLSVSGSVYIDNENAERSPQVQETKETFISENGLCRISKKESYYDVVLDFENGTPYEVGCEYGKTIKEAFPEYESVVEPYLYENIRSGLPALGNDFTPLLERTGALFSSLPEEYKEEIKGLSEALSEGNEDVFKEDGTLSSEEVIAFELIPDALRGTACSSFTAGPGRTDTGARISGRLLEWDLGSANQMCMIHALVHVKKSERSHTDISFLGMSGIITSVNDDGVFAAIHDVSTGDPYEYEGKESYIFSLRYALEEFDNARDAAEYMTGKSSMFTYSHNLLFTDAGEAFCAEDNIRPGKAVLRCEDSELPEELGWKDRESLCIVNDFILSEKNEPMNADNIIRFYKYRMLTESREKLTGADIKKMMTGEDISNHKRTGYVYSEYVSHFVVIDYDTHSIHAVLTGPQGAVNAPVFTDLGTYD